MVLLLKIYSWAKSKSWVFDIGFARMNRKSGETSPGWAPHMLVFCVIAMAIGAAVQFGWQRQWLSWPLFVIDTLTSFASLRLIRRYWWMLRRMGIFGAKRARWWFELAGLACTLTMALGVSAMAHGLPGVQFPGAKWVNDVLGDGARLMGIAFLLTATIAMVIGLVQGKRVRGRSVELVAWFYWSFVLISAFLSLPDQWLLPAGGVVFAIGCVVGIALYADKKAIPDRFA